MKIREIEAAAITEAVERLCIQANLHLPEDIRAAEEAAIGAEPWPLARNTLELLRSNLDAAAEKELPICQDTGMACVFVEPVSYTHLTLPTT